MTVLVYGAGGHGKVVADIVLASGKCLGGFLDDNLPRGSKALGYPIVGDAACLSSLPRDHTVALGIGDNAARKRVAERCAEHGITLFTALHPSAVISSSAVVEPGCVVMPAAVLNAQVWIGRGAIINTGAIVEHDCRVGNFAHAAPGSIMAGNSTVGDNSMLGAGAIILPGVCVGSDTIIGAGAVVHRNVCDRVVAAGVPASVLRQRH